MKHYILLCLIIILLAFAASYNPGPKVTQGMEVIDISDNVMDFHFYTEWARQNQDVAPGWFAPWGYSAEFGGGITFIQTGNLTRQDYIQGKPSLGNSDNYVDRSDVIDAGKPSGSSDNFSFGLRFISPLRNFNNTDLFGLEKWDTHGWTIDGHKCP